MPGYELVGKEELESIKRIFSEGNNNLYRYNPSRKISLVEDFERKFADKIGVEYAHAVSSGTAAIDIALSAAGIKQGDEVIITSFTFVAPVETIFRHGAIPVPVEIDRSYHFSPEAIEKAITEKTRAVVAVPMWAPVDYDAVIKICNKHNLILIEDSAQCLGGTYKGKHVGTFGTIGSFSFDIGKLITTGEGGMVITNDKDLYDRIAEYSDHGHMHDPSVPRGSDPRREPGFNYRMSEISGAVGLAQMEKFDYILEKQSENKEKVKQALTQIECINFREFSDESGQIDDTIVIELPDAQGALKVADMMASQGVGNKILPEACEWHFAGYWKHIFKYVEGYDENNLMAYWPKTDELLRKSICVPISVIMDKNRIEKVISGIKISVEKVF